jgi:signal transduction histidine kinase
MLLARLVDDLLDVTRISRGKVQLRTGRVDLTHVVGEAVQDHRALFEGEGVALEVALPSGPLWLEGDPARLAQVIGNLLHNASKFTPPGGRVAVALEAMPGANRAELRVEDDGEGIAAGLLPRLFEPFTQADTSLDRSRGGLGLGLALVKGLVELHGGTVAAASEGPGRGARFTVRLPLADDGAP